MRTYQIIFKGGLTRNVLADGYRTKGREIVFHIAGQTTHHFTNDSVIMVDDLGELPGYFTTVPVEAVMLVPVQ